MPAQFVQLHYAQLVLPVPQAWMPIVGGVSAPRLKAPLTIFVKLWLV